MHNIDGLRRLPRLNHGSGVCFKVQLSSWFDAHLPRLITSRMDHCFRLDNRYRGQPSKSRQCGSRPCYFQLPILCASEMARQIDHVGLHIYSRGLESLVSETAQPSRDDWWYLPRHIFHLLGNHVGCSSQTQQHRLCLQNSTSRFEWLD